VEEKQGHARGHINVVSAAKANVPTNLLTTVIGALPKARAV